MDSIAQSLALSMHSDEAPEANPFFPGLYGWAVTYHLHPSPINDAFHEFIAAVEEAEENGVYNHYSECRKNVEVKGIIERLQKAFLLNFDGLEEVTEKLVGLTAGDSISLKLRKVRSKPNELPVRSADCTDKYREILHFFVDFLDKASVIEDSMLEKGREEQVLKLRQNIIRYVEDILGVFGIRDHMDTHLVEYGRNVEFSSQLAALSIAFLSLNQLTTAAERVRLAYVTILNLQRGDSTAEGMKVSAGDMEIFSQVDKSPKSLLFNVNKMRHKGDEKEMRV